MSDRKSMKKMMEETPEFTEEEHKALVAKFEQWEDELRDFYYADPALRKWFKANPSRSQQDPFYQKDIAYMGETGYFPWEVFQDVDMNNGWRRLLLLARGQIKSPDRKCEAYLLEMAGYSHSKPVSRKPTRKRRRKKNTVGNDKYTSAQHM